MVRAAGIACVAGGYAAAVVVAVRLRPQLRLGIRRLSAVPVALLFVAGALLGIGASMLRTDASAVMWVALPLLAGACVVAHVLPLVAGDGPMRT